MNAMTGALDAMARDAAATPHRGFLDSAAEERYAQIGSRLKELDVPVRLRLATSVKTNPEPNLLATSRRHGAYAEVISPGELALALRVGFAANEIVYNGPFRCDADRAPAPLAFAFADSIKALDRYLHDAIAEVPGVRIRPPGIDSRFGVPAARLDEVARLAREACPKSFALSFHVRPQDYGGRTWSELAHAVIAAAVHLTETMGTPIVAFDGGGGWTPDAFDALLDVELPNVARAIGERLPSVRELIIEPGQAMATPTEALVTSIIEVRHNHRGRDVVVDATIALLPKIDAYPHRIYAVDGDETTLLQSGSDRIFGCACLEDDILAYGVTLPASVSEGDRLIIADCGSYDASMAFAFAGHART